MISVLKSLFAGPGIDKTRLQDAIIVDVRTVQEFANGHLEESVNIPLSDISDHIIDFKKSGKLIVLICRSGARSGRAAKLLRSHGIDAVNGGPWNTLYN